MKRNVLVGGAGLAGWMTAAVIARQFSTSVDVTVVECDEAGDHDLFYGNIAPPSAYAFNLSAGVSEPRLLLETNTAFSWGTRYLRWGAAERSWMQCFHLPLPVIGGVLFHHYLRKLGTLELEPFLVSALAAGRGLFAQPRENGPTSHRRCEYGYQLDPDSYQKVFRASAIAAGVKFARGVVVEVERNDRGIGGLRLSDGSVLRGDLYLDCTGPAARILSALNAGFRGGRRLRALLHREPVAQLGVPCRTVSALELGWQSQAPLQGSVARLAVFSPEPANAAVQLGCREAAWVQNCVAIGHAAAIVEPLTPAPILLLQRDIERLCSLMPLSDEMSVERREFNRQQSDDFVHAEIFNRALLESGAFPDSRYWREARDAPMHEKLAQKLAQFDSRGVLVSFDLEVFDPEDWTILHCGMGRRPARYDRVADRASETEICNYLSNLRRDVERVVHSLPPHHEYMAGLHRFVRQQSR